MSITVTRIWICRPLGKVPAYLVRKRVLTEPDVPVYAKYLEGIINSRFKTQIAARLPSL